MTGSKSQGVILQDRDGRFLQELGNMRLVDLAQAQVVCGFGSYTRTHDRLTRLERAGFLRRFYLPTEAGGRKAVFGLSAKGALAASIEFRPIKGRPDRLLSGYQFGNHQLAVNDIFVAAKFQSLPVNVRLIGFRTFSQPLSKTALLTPDGYLELESRDEIKAMFLEIDLSSEAHRVWQKKIGSYVQLAVTGEFSRLFSRPQFRVLVITDSSRRMENLRKLTAKATDKIFWFSTLSSIKASGLCSAVWLRPQGDLAHPLV